MLRSFRHWFGRGRTCLIRRPSRLRLTALEERAVPTQFVVTNTANSGAGSLRQAVLDANAATGADEVVFDPTVFSSPQTITLTGGAISVSEILSVTGPGQSLLSVSGNNASRIITVGNGVAISASGMTLTQGKDANGSAIYAVQAAVALTDVSLTANSGGPAMAAANANLTRITANENSGGPVVRVQHFVGNPVSPGLSATDCKFTNNDGAKLNGGAISFEMNAVPANATLTRCTFSSNNSPNGGAVSVVGSEALEVVLSDCTLSGNTATGGGGAIRFSSDGKLSLIGG